jgi:Icc-related predicted phosphoesterase
MIVATADVHYTKTRRKKIKKEKEKLKDARVFIVAGDITVKGGIAETYWFAKIFEDVNVQKLYIYGHHKKIHSFVLQKTWWCVSH